jgi:hypothetical protein
LRQRQLAFASDSLHQFLGEPLNVAEALQSLFPAFGGTWAFASRVIQCNLSPRPVVTRARIGGRRAIYSSTFAAPAVS